VDLCRGHVCQRWHIISSCQKKTGKQSISQSIISNPHCSVTVTVTVLRLTGLAAEPSEAYQPILQLVGQRGGREDSTAAASLANANADGRDSSDQVSTLCMFVARPQLSFCLAAGPLQAVLGIVRGELVASRPVRDSVFGSVQ
jgi:hypothetical protein